MIMPSHKLTVLSLFLALSLLACGGNVSGGPEEIDAGPLACTGVLCGDPALCCDQGSECIQGACSITCDTGIRCGESLDLCCAEGHLCLGALCAQPGSACLDSYDCMQPGEFCEPTIGRCLPQPDPLGCEIQPIFGALTVQVESFFDRKDAEDLNEEIISIPVVADLDGDGIPEVVVNMARQDGTNWPTGTIVILDGSDVSTIEKGPFLHDPDNGSYGANGRTTLALGDVNGDLQPDIIYNARPSGGPTASGLATNVGPIVAIDYEGNLLWTSHNAAGQMTGYNLGNAAISTANLDSDPETEIIIGGLILDHDGTELASVGAGVNEGTNDGYTGGITAIADLDDDGQPELVSGKSAWKISIDQGPPVVATVTNYWTSVGTDGYPAIADFDQDGTPEVVVVSATSVRILNGQTGVLWCGQASCPAPADLTQPMLLPGGPTANRGGPPTISDFDADGRPEIGVAGGQAYTVFDINRPSESLETFGTPTPAAVGTGELFYRWSYATKDASSNSTGSSVFDFQGDGAAEVVYADECYMRVFSGTDGTVQLELQSTSATIHEYPLVVDVDADGNSEILIVSQIAGAASNCAGEVPAVVPRQGLYVYGDSNDEWVPTRQVWTQHTYHVTNTGSDGNVPMTELDNWLQPGLNNYRQNVQGDGVFNAPDLALDLSVQLEACGTNQLLLQARVSNLGALGIAPGVSVEFFEGSDETGTLLGTALTPVALLPGQSTTVSLEIPAPAQPANYFSRVDGDSASGVVEECNEGNNTDATTGAACDIVL